MARAPSPLPDLSLTEWVVLALVCEGVSYGWPIVHELAEDGPIGRVWTVKRAKVYWAVDQLETKGLVQQRGHASGDGPARTLLAPTAAGRRAVRTWLRLPTPHVRDLRTEFLVKLLLLERSGTDPGPLVRRQRAALDPQMAQLLGARPTSVVDVWRQESLRAVDRFLDRLAGS
jgi:PadR family transcriptional regulator AphA